MRRRLFFIAALLGLQAWGQAPARLEFEVASIKPSKPDVRPLGIKPLPGGQTYVSLGTPIKYVFMLMYKITARQFVGGPGWLESDLYDIEGKAARPSNIDELHTMFQNLLADQFKIQFHKEIREQSVYAMVLDKGGSKMKVNETAEDFKIPLTFAGRGKMTAVRVSMSYFCWFLSQRLDRTVIDRTGLGKNYDFTLEWAQEPQRPGADAPVVSDSDGPTLFTALREQLGLKLEAQKGPVEVYVIDHAERPEAN